MVNIQIVDAATADVTNTTLTNKIGLAEGPFGLQEFESISSFLLSNGRSWNVSIRTSDIASVIFTILVLTFAIDKYIFKSRYLVHIGGATRTKDDAAALDEKASLHEKEALNVENGQKSSKDEDNDLKRQSGQTSDSPASTARSRIIQMLLILFLYLISDGKTRKGIASKTHEEAPESSCAKAEAEGEVDKPTPTSLWGRFVRHPWVQWVMSLAILLLCLLAMLGVFAFHLLFWPFVLTLFILLQYSFQVEVSHGATIPWQSVALKSISHLAVWTIVGVTLMMKPNRFQGVLWKCIKFTYAVNWWLFWVPFESFYLSSCVARRFGFHYGGTATEAFLFIMRPSLVAYLYFGVVRDAVVAVRLCKFFWRNDITKPVKS